METTIVIDDIILEKAMAVTGIKEQSSLVRLSLESLIACKSSEKLALLGGSERNLQTIPRRRMDEDV